MYLARKRFKISKHVRIGIDAQELFVIGNGIVQIQIDLVAT